MSLPKTSCAMSMTRCVTLESRIVPDATMGAKSFSDGCLIRSSERPLRPQSRAAYTLPSEYPQCEPMLPHQSLGVGICKDGRCTQTRGVLDLESRLRIGSPHDRIERCTVARVRRISRCFHCPRVLPHSPEDRVVSHHCYNQGSTHACNGDEPVLWLDVRRVLFIGQIFQIWDVFGLLPLRLAILTARQTHFLRGFQSSFSRLKIYRKQHYCLIIPYRMRLRQWWFRLPSRWNELATYKFRAK